MLKLSGKNQMTNAAMNGRVGPVASPMPGRDFDESLSAMVDGEVDSAIAAQLCDGWRQDQATRRAWHSYQLIGDVLRSEDLSSSAKRDAEFLSKLQSRLVLEPVSIGPQILLETPLQARRGRTSATRRWATPVAVAAGFMAVAGVLLVNGLTIAPTGGAVLASAGSGGSLTQAVAAAPGVQMVSTLPRQALVDARSEPGTVVANGQLIRSARLDRYLAAHKQFGGSSAPGTPLGYLRSASVEASGK